MIKSFVNKYASITCARKKPWIGNDGRCSEIHNHSLYKGKAQSDDVKGIHENSTETGEPGTDEGKYRTE